MVLVCVAAIPGFAGDTTKTGQPKGTLTVSASPEMFDLTRVWANAFMSANPGTSIRVVADDGTVSPGTAGLQVMTQERAKSVTSEPAWKMVVGRDAVVPFVSASNPYLDDIRREGIASGEFANLFETEGTRTWAGLLDGGASKSVNFYLGADEGVRSAISGFTGMDPVFIEGIASAGSANVIESVAGDPYGVGFARLADITGITGELAAGIALLPIDRNANGRLDYVEKIYGSVADLSRGIWIGKYPSALCGNIYVIAPVQPEEASETAFLKYILTTGQASLELAGFNSLVSSERLSRIDRLPDNGFISSSGEGVNTMQLLITIIAGLAVILAIVLAVARYRRSNLPLNLNAASELAGISEASMSIPKGLLFDKTHTWTFMETDGTVKVGIDDFLQHVTGNLTGIKMKLPGEKIRKGDPILTLVQKGKRLVISAPVSGIIIADNSILFTDPSLLNSAPYTEGWVYRIQPTNWMRETQFLFMAEKYSEWLRTEFTRLRDFLAGILKHENPEYAFAVLQDGGEVRDHILESLPPEAWEEFQIRFIDESKKQ
jgi:glycine cleavage system H lipoate-binding protein/ABC-type phosphate transport system substrate-binding protein